MTHTEKRAFPLEHAREEGPGRPTKTGSRALVSIHMHARTLSHMKELHLYIEKPRIIMDDDVCSFSLFRAELQGEGGV